MRETRTITALSATQGVPFNTLSHNPLSMLIWKVTMMMTEAYAEMETMTLRSRQDDVETSFGVEEYINV